MVNNNPQIDFAKRHLVSELSFFTASAAIFRMQDLIEDIENLGHALRAGTDDDEGVFRRALEIVNYYRVGFVTCLEWHAKSRLFDTFSYYPKSIEAADVKRAASDQKLALMVAEGLSVQHLLAGSSSISSKEAYVSAVQRVFKAISAPDNALSLILGEVAEQHASIGGLLDSLYDGRNELVHEIGVQRIGHINLRA